MAELQFWAFDLNMYTLDRDAASTFSNFEGPKYQILSIRTRYQPRRVLTQMRHPQAPFRFPTPSIAYLITVVMSSDGSSWMLQVQLPEILTPELNVMATVCIWVLNLFSRQNFSHKNPIDSDIGAFISMPPWGCDAPMW